MCESRAELALLGGHPGCEVAHVFTTIDGCAQGFIDLYWALHGFQGWPLEGNLALSRKNHMENPIQKSGSSPVPPPLKIQMFVQDLPYEFSEKVSGCLPVASSSNLLETCKKRYRNRVSFLTFCQVVLSFYCCFLVVY